MCRGKGQRPHDYEIKGLLPAWIRNAHTGEPRHDGIPGLCKSATAAEIAAHGHVLTPGRYVGAKELEAELAGDTLPNDDTKGDAP